LENYRKALQSFEQLSDKKSICAGYINIGSIYIRLGKAKEAREYLEKSLALSLSVGAKERIKESYLGLMEVDSMTGNYKGALENYKMSVRYRDSLVNEDNTRKTVQAQIV